MMLAAGLVAGVPAQPAVATPAGPDATVTVEAALHDQLAEYGTADFWVYLKPQADLTGAASLADRSAQGWHVYQELTSTAKESQAGLLALLEQHGIDYESYWIANTVKVIGGDADLLAKIIARPEVDQVTTDKIYSIPTPIAAVDEPKVDAVEWGIAEINADEVWSDFGATGEGIVVANIDTGVMFDHPALVEQYRGNNGDGTFDHNYHWWDPSSICSPGVPCDNNGHGTHTMGTILGSDGGENQIGVAPGATWIAAKGCESSSCSQSALLSSGQWIVAPTDLEGNNPDPDRRPHIVNNSWGGGATSDPWYQATVQSWVAAGIFPVFSNGNSGPGCATAGNPANLVESYAVGAYDSSGNIASFSSRGPSAWDSSLIKPNIAAPGVSVRSAWNNGGYNSISGTSMAAPHVAGVVALMWSAAISLQWDIDATRELLDTTARDTADSQCGGTDENNNVWGEGKLDAYAAVEQSPRGPIGTLTGAVTDADTGDPIARATVEVVGEVERKLTTGSDGTYQTTLPAGDYTVTASAFGYGEATTTVTISEDATTVQDFPLTPMDNVTISGQITDGSGHGWPLYAKVTVDGTPVQTYTDPYTGTYSLRLPSEAEYTLSISAEYPGYRTRSHTVEVTDEDVTLDVALTADGCALAPGYEFGSSVGIMGDFNGNLAAFLASRGIPSSTLSWGDDVSSYDVIIVNRAGDPGAATFQQFLADTDAAGVGVVFLDTWSNSGNGIYLLTTHLGNPATRGTGFASSNPYLAYQVTQEHEIFDGFSVGDEIILDELSSFKDYAYFTDYTGEGRAMIADAVRADQGVVGGGVGVQERANNRHVLLSMHGASSYTNPLEWHPDGAQLFINALQWVSDGSFECEVIEGGLVVGHVTDLNAGNPLDGATVTNEAGESATTAPTPDDPALDDGFYWMFSSGSGEQEFTASRSGYASDTRTVNVVADAVTEASFALGVGQLEVTPSEIEVELHSGQTAKRQVTITNTGTGAVEVELTERGGDFEILGGGAVASTGQVQELPGVFTPAASPSGGAEFTRASAPPVAAEPWETIADYPVSIMDNAAVELDGIVYSFGGYISGAVANAYAYDPATDEWSSITNLPEPRQKPGVAAIDGLIYVVGGWPAPAQTTTYIYDPATDTWSQGADMPAGRAAPGVAVVDGQLYVVGGCTDGSCATSNTVFRYDPATDSWTTLANYPLNTAWLGCGGLDGKVVCAGGNAGGTESTVQTHIYDPATDSWTRAADLPYDNWARAAAVANDQLVLSAGVTDGASTVTNRTVAYDLASDTWTELEPANRAVYRTAGACGYYKVGGSTGGFSPSPGSEVHPEWSNCEAPATDVPWLSLDTTSFTLAPGESITVTVTLDSSAVEQDQPGTHTAAIRIGHNTPYPVDPVAVSMTVKAPLTWGKVEGTVTSVSCSGAEAPLANAIVQINTRTDQITLITDRNGEYAYWLPVLSNPVQLIVAGSWHVPQTRTVIVLPGRATEANFALAAICLGGVNHRPV